MSPVASVDLPPPPPAIIEQVVTFGESLAATLDQLSQITARSDQLAKAGQPWRYRGEFERLSQQYAALSLEARQKVETFNALKAQMVSYNDRLHQYGLARAEERDRAVETFYRYDDATHRLIVLLACSALAPLLVAVFSWLAG
jgi:hypothetical protein